ncbi:peptidylprolyl isomerase fpr3 [Coemansia sp. Cherry 401B]|nr:peptidylprolyl isomerase fpr3 [Coemansia sp. Cherry 401B]
MSFRGFWGLKIAPGKTYSQTVAASFRVSNAALGLTLANTQRTSVVLTVGDKKFVLCSLTPKTNEQQQVDITLTEGEDITFETEGGNEIHLTGNFLNEGDDESDMEDDEDGEEVDLSSLTPEDIQQMIDEGLINPDDLLNSSDEDAEYDSDDAEADERIRELTSDEEAELMAEAESQEESSEDQQPEPVTEVKIKKQAKKAEQAEKKRKAAAAAEKEAEKEAKKPKKDDKKEAKKEEAKKEKSKTLNLQGGVVAEVKKEGTGSGVKKGARVGMYYIGKLTSGKVFDQNTKGKPFWFRLGKGEVISGWDVGIAGMKKGGERRLTIPAAMAYGKRGAPPDIPPNATLVFDIRLIDFK